MKREAELKSAFMKELKVQLPSFLVFLLTSAGWPDRGIVGAKRTTFWEFKHATPEFESPGLQELTCMRLAVEGFCRYVIWWETSTGIGQRTMIVTPRAVHDRQGWTLNPETSCTGFNQHWLVEYVKRAHGVLP